MGAPTPAWTPSRRWRGAYNISVHDLLEGVEFYGQNSEGSMPKGLSDLVADPVLGTQITPDWVRTLSRIELRGKRPRDKGDWYEIYLHLKRILD